MKKTGYKYGGGLVTKPCPTLVSPWTVTCQIPLSMEFSRQEYWSGSPALQADSLPTELKGKPKYDIKYPYNYLTFIIIDFNIYNISTSYQKALSTFCLKARSIFYQEIILKAHKMQHTFL